MQVNYDLTVKPTSWLYLFIFLIRGPREKFHTTMILAASGEVKSSFIQDFFLMNPHCRVTSISHEMQKLLGELKALTNTVN